MYLLAFHDDFITCPGGPGQLGVCIRDLKHYDADQKFPEKVDRRSELEISVRYPFWTLYYYSIDSSQVNMFRDIILTDCKQRKFAETVSSTSTSCQGGGLRIPTFHCALLFHNFGAVTHTCRDNARTVPSQAGVYFVDKLPNWINNAAAPNDKKAFETLFSAGVEAVQDLIAYFCGIHEVNAPSIPMVKDTNAV
ncbi:hypothetical protein J6590_082855 [Homalodisca vitripennis]|nr:hypothetical protein J6590_082855 [Homalodisca vitripennis]